MTANEICNRERCAKPLERKYVTYKTVAKDIDIILRLDLLDFRNFGENGRKD